ncbi:Gfo/Idh/MocA family protein [Maribacter sp. 4U21]|uniref:Gfo/Idh/MocA family protein n=1 Tax=Maribacter sp. 4U21 TaxID=1889779 RepID=UPI00211EB7E9|nr:Gfo/Idh/MocA family oxidoreductase [Maribacter sp. 4U21]
MDKLQTPFRMIRWGIVGAGNIAHTFAKDMALVKDNAITAVASRDVTKAQEFAAHYNAPHAFGSYEDLFKSDTVDVVYIATPHTSHAALSIMAMDYKKHVLCEKPLGINGAEVAGMLEKAKGNKVFLMEALWTRFNPTIKKVKELVENGEIGALGYLKADFAFYGLDRDEKGRILNPALAGGSILDIGIYPIFLAYLLLGMPDNITAKSNFHKTGVEVQTSMIFEYEQAQAILYSGLSSNSEMKAEIAGSKGSIYIKPRWHETSGYIVQKGQETTDVEVGKVGKGYSYEIQEVQRCLEAGLLQSELWSHKNSTDLCALLDTVRNKAGVRFPFEG